MCMSSQGLIPLTVGEDVKWTFDFTDEDGEPTDLTGYNFTCYIAKEFGTKEIVHTSSTDNGEILLGETGEIIIQSSPMLSKGSYIVQLEYVKPDGTTHIPTHTYLEVYPTV